jgi:phosphopentomutase
MAEFERRIGRGWLGNYPASGTEIIKDLGAEHLKTGRVIVYTSGDSVFQIAAHEEVVSLEELYRFCRIARELLSGEHAVGRVIARPFIGEPGHFTRTEHRQDFSLEPLGETILDAVKASGQEVIGVGKIEDIFAHRGLTQSNHTGNNMAGSRPSSNFASRIIRA